MLSKRPIRDKLVFGVTVLIGVVAALALAGFWSVYSYRGLVRSVSSRATELPLAGTIREQVADLQLTAGTMEVPSESVAGSADMLELQEKSARFANQLQTLRETLAEYWDELINHAEEDSLISDKSAEKLTFFQIQDALGRLVQWSQEGTWYHDAENVEKVRAEVMTLQQLAKRLPSHLHEQIHDLAQNVRLQYRTLIVLTWLTTITAGILLTLCLRWFWNWIFWPLQILIEGSRRVAGGDFDFRIHLDTDDEMAELAAALNDMTQRFQVICQDLDGQVQERTKQVVRSEQLASVGFLAAGVAHEINNPLASIAMCAESLEDRMQDWIAEQPDSEMAQGVVHYLDLIQKEAFRCKGITERLLDFSRMGDLKRHPTELTELVAGVIDVVRHVSKYRGQTILFRPKGATYAAVNPQEIKQVVLNLITNALDSLDDQGQVVVEVREVAGQAELHISDNGCGMSEEVLQHLFEPFFTRRKTGQGIGLGLSITYRIIADHQGTIQVTSGGPGQGSAFCVRLPSYQQKELDHRHQAA